MSVGSGAEVSFWDKRRLRNFCRAGEAGSFKLVAYASRKAGVSSGLMSCSRIWLRRKLNCGSRMPFFSR